jgi:predicted ATP-dependent endonuclease of OLD family
VSFSIDGVTAIVGQNESGKSSILEALSMTMGGRGLEPSDLRFGSKTSEVLLRVEIDEGELQPFLDDFPAPLQKPIRDFVASAKWEAEFRYYWEVSKSNEFDGMVEATIPGLSEFVIKAWSELDSSDHASNSSTPTAATGVNSDKPKDAAPPDKDDISSKLYDVLSETSPSFVLFSDSSGLLPDSIDVTAEHKLSGVGATGARNLLNVAGIELKQLVTGSDSDQANILKRANERVTKLFRDFWSQTIGKSNKLAIETEVKIGRSGERAGKSYLVFWITDGNNRLSPSQRSKGLRWFVSFFLQLKASEISGSARYFLLDEPGANLHEKAQKDVLRLINLIKDNLAGVMYSTHSPHLLEYDKIHRVLAVQREGEGDDSPTVVVDALRLGAANRDTMSPILTVMGVDLSRQQAISKNNNVLLEEISAFFYLQAIWKLLGKKSKANFLAATGVSNLPQLCQLFLGWGLEFIVVVDDEPSARRVLAELKRDLCANDDVQAAAKLLKIKGCAGVEDLFTPRDFRKYVLSNEKALLPDTNSAYMKKHGESKPIAAALFMKSVEQGKIGLADFEESTIAAISSLANEIESRLGVN